MVFVMAEVISGKGLILFFNHHCGFDAIQNHSTLGKNIQHGFWAYQYGRNCPMPGSPPHSLCIEDVTGQVLQGTEGMTDEKRKTISH